MGHASTSRWFQSVGIQNRAETLHRCSHRWLPGSHAVTLTIRARNHRARWIQGMADSGAGAGVDVDISCKWTVPQTIAAKPTVHPHSWHHARISAVHRKLDIRRHHILVVPNHELVLTSLRCTQTSVTMSRPTVQVIVNVS